MDSKMLFTDLCFLQSDTLPLADVITFLQRLCFKEELGIVDPNVPRCAPYAVYLLRQLIRKDKLSQEQDTSEDELETSIRSSDEEESKPIRDDEPETTQEAEPELTPKDELETPNLDQEDDQPQPRYLPAGAESDSDSDPFAFLVESESEEEQVETFCFFCDQPYDNGFDRHSDHVIYTKRANGHIIYKNPPASPDSH